MQIFGPFRVSTTQATNQAQRLQPQAKAEANSAANRSGGPVDQLDLSSSVSRLDAGSQTAGDGIRVDRVADLRRQIAGGGYDTAEKLDQALERMFERLA